MIAEPYTHRAVVPKDDGEPVTFKWHFQRGLLKPRMSGYELASFVIHHMFGILSMGLFDNHPRVKSDFEAMAVLLTTSPKKAIDRILPWIRTVYHTEEDDIIHMSLFDNTPQPEGPKYFVMS